ncbi:MAG TPA: B12-binding domain-containing radical SAM protein [Vicinamibacterales bacterium]|nr:B12-binding domain-containing radical SAM protein [Vicinamibacterales bacterium]
MPDVVFVNPRFEPSYWGMEYALPLLGKGAAMPVAALPLLAALTPPGYGVRIVDENVTPIDFDRLASADIVAVTGMSVQRQRMTEILTEFKRRGAFTVVGGPWVTVKEDYFGTLADVIFVGEAEETWPAFLLDFAAGQHQRRYEQPEKTDLSHIPVPRYDLLPMHRYVFGSVQLSRGCPFQCEFCDIIVTFGRRPRYKTVPQITAELDALKRQGMQIVFIVDDNLIGNRRFARAVLPEIADWQKRNGYPFIFTTEASLDLAEQDDIMRMMLDANILSVFVGVESPDEEALRETRKFQNLIKHATVLERVHRIQDAGLEVWCGMIVGFDHDEPQVFRRQLEFLQRSRISDAMVGMLFAIPKTPLYDRLAAEGRLDPQDGSPFGTNVLPLKMSRDELRDGYVNMMRTLYEPRAYFERLDDFTTRPAFRFAPRQREYMRKHPLSRVAWSAKYVLGGAVLFLRLMHRVAQSDLRAEYRRRLLRLVARHKREPALWFAYALKCAMHYHYFTMTTEMSVERGAIVNSYQ